MTGEAVLETVVAIVMSVTAAISSAIVVGLKAVLLYSKASPQTAYEHLNDLGNPLKYIVLGFSLSGLTSAFDNVKPFHLILHSVFLLFFLSVGIFFVQIHFDSNQLVVKGIGLMLLFGWVISAILGIKFVYRYWRTIRSSSVVQ